MPLDAYWHWWRYVILTDNSVCELIHKQHVTVYLKFTVCQNHLVNVVCTMVCFRYGSYGASQEGKGGRKSCSSSGCCLPGQHNLVHTRLRSWAGLTCTYGNILQSYPWPPKVCILASPHPFASIPFWHLICHAGYLISVIKRSYDCRLQISWKTVSTYQL